jgi:hypothetical protein
MKRNVMKGSRVAMMFVVAAAWPIACGSDSPPPPPPEQTGQACTDVGQCYPGIDGGSFMGGPAVCLDTQGGYCTHVCMADTDCCAIPGECKTGFPQVCSPFESRPDKYCILSCEDSQVADAGVTDANAFCATYAHAGFTCRSSGGGSQNRKVCMP